MKVIPERRCSRILQNHHVVVNPLKTRSFEGYLFGKHVNLAARIGGSATGGEILVSSLLAQLVGPSGEFTLSERPAMSLKGLDGEHVTHEVGWR